MRWSVDWCRWRKRRPLTAVLRRRRVHRRASVTRRVVLSTARGEVWPSCRMASPPTVCSSISTVTCSRRRRCAVETSLDWRLSNISTSASAASSDSRFEMHRLCVILYIPVIHNYYHHLSLFLCFNYTLKSFSPQGPIALSVARCYFPSLWTDKCKAHALFSVCDEQKKQESQI